jgi:DNA-binding beta-propeller fold protein YncE
MSRLLRHLKAVTAFALAMHQAFSPRASVAATPLPLASFLSPTSLAATRDGKTLFIACVTAQCVLRFHIAEGKVWDAVAVPTSPSDLALSADDRHLYVTCAAPCSAVCIIDVAQISFSAASANSSHPFNALTLHRSNAPTPSVAPRILATVPVGHTTMAPVPSPDGQTLYACNRFNNDVSVVSLARTKERCRIAVPREPVAADITKDGRFLLVASHLPQGRADADLVSASVSVIDVATASVVKEIHLPNGSGSLNSLRISPDGKYAVVTHLLAQFNRPTTHAYGGWMNANVLSIIDLSHMAILATVQLDDPESGAANPWALAWSPEGDKIVITHAGTHELSIINFPALLAKLVRSETVAGVPFEAQGPQSTALNPQASTLNLLQPLPFGVRQRVKLPKTDLGPRAVVIAGHTAYTANYFSDTLSAVDLAAPYPKAQSIPLGPHREMSISRKGEFYFHSATICFQGWQSCSSCHPGDARADGFNWDLLNDGIGNPKNTKSLLLAFQTPPSMWLGVRETAETAVRAGIRHILFTKQPEEVALAIDEYLQTLKPVPSPYLVHGKLSDSAERGNTVFTRAGCATCHPPGLFTDLHQYDVGTRRSFDRPTDKFDTPTLVELWRTAPYLHDGSAATVRDVLTTRNSHDRHGKTAALSDREINDLCTYLLSL